jgi:hypothetical protein
VLGEEPEPTRRSVAQWSAIVVGSLGATAVTLLLAMLIANIGFEYRRGSSHQGRLARLVEKAPRLDQVQEGLAGEGAHEVAAAGDAAALARLAEDWGDGRRGEVLEKGARWASTRAFLTGDFVYILYFDGERVLRDFTCVRRTRDGGGTSGLPLGRPFDRLATRAPHPQRSAATRGRGASPGIGCPCEDMRPWAGSWGLGARPGMPGEVVTG